ncbi:MAG: 3-hydroxybutyryl-CoA dehydrogenase [Ignavibacteria bacterium]|nr:3-hydroxybutyryl-CoA dehydrogenase [Ignavibacteria bacterium]
MTSMTIGICGSGTMGRGIAIACLLGGHRVILFDSAPEQIQRCAGFIAEHIGKMVEKTRLSDADRIAMLSRLTTASALNVLTECQLIIEAIVENLESKHELFIALEDVVSETSILATNTSSISIAAIARPLQHPERFVGLHFFNPAAIMKLVEVIKGPHTSDVVIASCSTFAKQLGKTPVIARDVPGFIVNRVARNFYNEALRIVMERAASIKQVDDLMKGLGFRMGPFELMDLIGVDTNLDVTKSQWQQFFNEPRFQPSVLQQHYVDSGLLGKKSDGGFY